MNQPKLVNLLFVGMSALSLVGCENLPGSKGTQGAVIGGVGGAAVGAAVGGEKHRALGAVLGAALGTAGGYVVGANSDRILGKDHDAAEQAARNSQERPATAADAQRATTADLNNDGFVTMDEVVALRDAGLSDSQMLERLRATEQVFELTADQKQYLTGRGVSQYVVDQMEALNRSTRDRLMTPSGTTSGGAYPANQPISTPPVISPKTTTSPAPPESVPPVIGQPSTIPAR